MYKTSSCLYENNLNIDWCRVVCVACYVVGLIGFSNHIIYNMTIDFGHILHVQYNYNWRLTQKLQDGIWLRFAKKKIVYSLRVISAPFSFCHPTLANSFAPS